MSATKDTTNCVKGTSTLVRPKFAPGMLLQHEDLEQLSTYTRELSRLLFRSFFGCGVICGLEVTPVQVCGKRGINVAAGLALDCSGDPVHLPAPKSLTIEKECDTELTGPLYVLLCRTEQCCSPRTSMCASDEDEAPSVCTRERDGFEICIVNESDLANKCHCRCKEGGYDADGKSDCQCASPNDPCYKDHYAGKCGCNAGKGCDCSCSCVLLAQLKKSDTDKKDQSWTIDHSVRRFVRPVLMRDPLLPPKKPDKKPEEQPGIAPVPPPTTKPKSEPVAPLTPAAEASAAEAAAAPAPAPAATPAPAAEAPAAEATAATAAEAAPTPEAETNDQTKKPPKAGKPKQQT